MGLRRQSGNVTLLAIFALFALGLGGGLYYIFSPGAVDENAQRLKDAKAAYEEAVASLDKALADPANFNASLDHNTAAFGCLYSGDGNCRGQGGAFLLFEAANPRHALSHLANDSGYDRYGGPCKGFPSADCPLRVETVWEPVCAGAGCEGTKSARVRAKVTLSAVAGNEAPLEWTKEALFTPPIQLSQAAQCGRGGGTWTGSECLSPSQLAERRIASPPGGATPEPAPVNLPPDSTAQAVQETPPEPVQAPVYECPNQVVVQGQYYAVQFLSADRGQVTTPAMSCPMPGATDVFVFQCTGKQPASFPNEGQWVQVEAVMAPACDQAGNPVGGSLPVRF
jgi:hypothetical protein